MSRVIVTVLLLAGSAVVFFAGQRRNPPGFFTDEASIAFNALQIARTGADEHGIRHPLFFKAFGEYKNPTFIYVLAGAFQLFPPSDLVARRVAALFGWLACVTIGALAYHVTGRMLIASISFLMAVFTPMIFEISRLAFEVAVYPLGTALFLLAVRAASQRERWRVLDIAAISVALLLLAYSYTIGRLFAVLAAVSLLIFFTRRRMSQIVAIFAIFALLGPVTMMLYDRANDGALTGRFRGMSYLVEFRDQPLKTVAALEYQLIGNLLPVGMALQGDLNPRHHVERSGGSILLATFILAAVGAWIAIRSRDRWWWFVLLGTFLSIVPASLTPDRNHTLRLAPYPVFLIALSILGLQWVLQRRRLAIVLIALAAVQAAFFMTVFHRTGAARGAYFDHGVKPAIHAALLRPERPVHVDRDIYIHAWWHGALRGAGREQFRIGLPSAPGALAVSPRGAPPGSELVAEKDGLTVYITH